MCMHFVLHLHTSQHHLDCKLQHESALGTAAAMGYVVATTALLAAGADVNAINREVG